MADQTFAQAFAAARKAKGAGATFTWQGKSYSTNRADDAPAARRSTTPTTSVRPQARPGSTSTAPAGGRGNGANEVTVRRADSAIKRAEAAATPTRRANTAANRTASAQGVADRARARTRTTSTATPAAAPASRTRSRRPGTTRSAPARTATTRGSSGRRNSR